MTKAISLDAKEPERYANRAFAYLKLKQYQNALDDCNKALSLNSKYAWAYILRGQAYGNLRQYQKAIDDNKKGVELDGTFVGVNPVNIFTSSF